MAKPEIRLKGFEGEWKKKPFSEMVYRVATSGDTKIMPGVEFEDIISGEGVLNKDIKKKKINKVGTCFEPGDVLFGKLRPYLKNILLADFRGVAIGDFWVLRPNNVNSNLLYMLVSSNNFMKVANISSGSKMPRADWNLVSNSDFYFPKEMDEQKSIADYFKSLDSMIQGVTKKIASLKQMKQACLVSMFPQAGETTPRVRFKGFKGEWEDVSFKDISYLAGTKNRDNLPLESYSISNEFGFIPQNEQFEKGGTMSNADKRMYYIVTPDSFAYNPARINVGSIGYDDLDKDVIVSSLYVVFKTDKETHNPFLSYWFKTPMFKKLIELYQEGGVRLYFFYDKLCQCHFRRPCLAEQQKIASYFTSLDKQISLQEARLEKLKHIKSACLDKMFV